MAIKKSELYKTLWKGCDELRGGMDASQYKDYVLVMLFLKYISDKSNYDKNFSIEIPQGCTFSDLIALKNKDKIGEEVNKILSKLSAANRQIAEVITLADFSDETKLGRGKDLVDTVTRLIGVFESSGLDFGRNRSENDDLMGDAYEFLMQHFATESGKSKGEFYTPAEVSRVMAKVIGIRNAKEANETLYDPTCGSGSLLLRAQSEAPLKITIFGQEKDVATSGLAKMNMILHGEDEADIRQGDTISDPKFLVDDTLKTFDYIVANPPFSTKSWMKGAQQQDQYGRWGRHMGVPPEKNGDYAFLLHIIRSLKPNGTGACILPHGVLFRGNAEYTIRKNVLKYIEGIIGLPANLFFGTGIPACILVLGKKEAATRKGIFMIDAKRGFVKDGAKNRLREQDIRRIVDTWEARKDIPHYARFVSYDRIEKEDYNLNLPRYIQTAEKEVVQDIEAHLKGGLPMHDIEQMELYWSACPTLRGELFEEDKPRAGYAALKVDNAAIRETIRSNKDYKRQGELFNRHFEEWKAEVHPILEGLNAKTKPKVVGTQLGDALLRHFLKDTLLVDGYDAYDVLMNYWNEAMQDDCYMVVDNGWTAELYVPQPAEKKAKNGAAKATKEKKAKTIADLACDLLPVELVVNRYFGEFYQTLLAAQEQLVEAEAQVAELEEEQSDYFDKSNFEGKKINESTLKKRMEELRTGGDAEELAVLVKYMECKEEIKEVKTVIKAIDAKLLAAVVERYRTLTVDEVRDLVVNDKWYGTLSERLGQQMQRVSQQLTSSVVSLVERYKDTLPELDRRVRDLEKRVASHLVAMGFNL